MRPRRDHPLRPRVESKLSRVPCPECANRWAEVRAAGRRGALMVKCLDGHLFLAFVGGNGRFQLRPQRTDLCELAGAAIAAAALAA